MTDIKSTNIKWHDSDVSRDVRAKILNQKGVTLWLTGLSGSGKSTVAVAAEKLLAGQNKLVYRLDGDNVRHGLNSNLTFTPEDRIENIRRIGEVSKLFADSGTITLVSFISPYQADRDIARKLHEEADLPFIEVFIHCPLAEVEKRDPKGLYKKARAGEIKNFTGIDAPYEAPQNPELEIRTDQLSIEESGQKIIDHLKSLGLLQA